LESEGIGNKSLCCGQGIIQVPAAYALASHIDLPGNAYGTEFAGAVEDINAGVGFWASDSNPNSVRLRLVLNRAVGTVVGTLSGAVNVHNRYIGEAS
jgi:hypothetical protein